MDVIQIGTLQLNALYVYILCFGLGAWVGLRWMGRANDRNQLDALLSLASNAFILWIVIWKASYMIVHFSIFIEKPMSLLFYDGGLLGQIIATCIVVLYSGYRLKKLNISYLVGICNFIIYIISGLTILLLLKIVNDQVFSFYLGLKLFVYFLILSICIVVKTFKEQLLTIQYGLLLLIFVLFFDPKRDILFLSFDRLQVMVALLLVSLHFIYRIAKERGNFDGHSDD